MLKRWQLHPNRLAVLADIALLAADRGHESGPNPIEILTVRGEIVGVRDVLGAECERLSRVRPVNSQNLSFTRSKRPSRSVSKMPSGARSYMIRKPLRTTRTIPHLRSRVDRR